MREPLLLQNFGHILDERRSKVRQVASARTGGVQVRQAPGNADTLSK